MATLYPFSKISTPHGQLGPMFSSGAPVALFDAAVQAAYINDR